MKKNASGALKACAFVRANLIFIAEKEIERPMTPDIRNHLDSCPACSFLVQRFAQAWKNSTIQEEVRPTPEFFPNLIKKIEAYEDLKSGRKGIFKAAWRILRPAALAAVFLGGIFAGNKMGKTEKIAAAPEETFTSRYLGIFENIPPGSVADFYISRHNLKKEDPE